MESSPAPSMSHSSKDVPGFEFSQTIALASGPQPGVTAAAGTAGKPTATSTVAEKAAAEIFAVRLNVVIKRRVIPMTKPISSPNDASPDARAWMPPKEHLSGACPAYGETQSLKY